MTRDKLQLEEVAFEHAKGGNVGILIQKANELTVPGAAGGGCTKRSARIGRRHARHFQIVCGQNRGRPCGSIDRWLRGLRDGWEQTAELQAEVELVNDLAQVQAGRRLTCSGSRRSATRRCRNGMRAGRVR